MAASTAQLTEQQLQDSEFMLDPRDRIADASIDEHAPEQSTYSVDNYDDESDFEILSKDELES